MKNFERIERYLNDEMESAEKEAFENECSLNKDLSIEVELQNQENLAIKSIALERLKKKIKDLDANKDQDIKKESGGPPSEDKSYKYLWLVFVLMLIACVLGMFAIQYNKVQQYDNEIHIDEKGNIEKIQENTAPINKIQHSPVQKGKLKDDGKEILPSKSKKIDRPSKQREIKNNNIKPSTKEVDYKLIAMANLPKEISNLRGEKKDASVNEKWSIINDLISTEKFSQAIENIDVIPKANPFFIDAQHLKAKVLLKTSNYKAAAEIYRSLLIDGDLFIIDTYQYELLISYLGQLPSASSKFKALLAELDANPDFTYKNEVEKIKSDLLKVKFNFE